jgi:type IV pilus assembly protein PilV
VRAEAQSSPVGVCRYPRSRRQLPDCVPRQSRWSGFPGISSALPPVPARHDYTLIWKTYFLPWRKQMTLLPTSWCSWKRRFCVRRSAAAQRGFSLVEVLVAVLVLSVGLLGLAALQVMGLRASDSARMRTEVSIAAYDLADRLRANPASFFSQGQASKGLQVIAPAECATVGAPGNALERWRKYVCDMRLPQPSSGDLAAVDCRDGNACGGGNCAITFRWSDARGETTAAGTGVRDPETVEFRFCTQIATAI